jgi:outer membrane protein assembly factor BamE
MPVFLSRFQAALPSLAKLPIYALAGWALSACGSFNNASNSLVSVITPYKVEVVQGNFVSKEQVQALRPGMSRAQVRDILGSPLVTSVFHADRWDYVFTIRRQGIEAQSRKLSVFFKGDDFDKADGDAMPSEAEFVATLDARRNLGKVPNLEASPEQLNRPAKSDAATGGAPANAAPPAPVTYPPLEPATR